MAPIVEISNETLKRLNSKFYILRNDLENKISNDNFIYIPSINLDVAKERTLFNTNFYNTQETLHKEGNKILTIPEFKEFLKYTRENHEDIYKEITEVRSSWRSEWIDADFKMQGKDLYVNYHIFDENGKIIEKSEKLDKETLMKNKTPGISLDSWLEDLSKQGLPQKSIESGSLYYWAPMKDNNSVARFGAYGNRAVFDASGGPSGRGSHLGVRVAKQHK